MNVAEAGDFVVTMGKYKGLALKDVLLTVPGQGWADWMLKQPWLAEPLKEALTALRAPQAGKPDPWIMREVGDGGAKPASVELPFDSKVHYTLPTMVGPMLVTELDVQRVRVRLTDVRLKTNYVTEDDRQFVSDILQDWLRMKKLGPS